MSGFAEEVVTLMGAESPVGTTDAVDVAGASRPRPAPAELSGTTIAVTADRRSLELLTVLGDRGATLLHAPTVRIGPVTDPGPLRRATQDLITDPPDDVVVTSAAGLEHWIWTAGNAGQAQDLHHVLRGTRVLARGARSREVVARAGLPLDPLVASHTAEIVDHLLAEGLQGRRIAVQTHPTGDPGLPALLTAAGAEVVTVSPYERQGAPDPAAVRQLLGRIGTRRLDAVMFTSAPAASGLLAAAAAEGQTGALRDALGGDVVAAAIGPVAAGPLWAAGMRTLLAPAPTFAALADFITTHLLRTRAGGCETPLGVLRVREDGALLDGERLELSGAPLAVLRELARRPGAVVDRARLARSLPRSGGGASAATAATGDLHAVETAVARLRAAVGHSGVVETVTKRGYRLAVASPARQAAGEHPA